MSVQTKKPPTHKRWRLLEAKWILVPLRRRCLAHLGRDLVVAILGPSRRVIRHGIRDWLVVGGTESWFHPIEHPAVALGIDCLLVQTAAQRLSDDVDGESPGGREYRGNVVGHHQTILRI